MIKVTIRTRRVRQLLAERNITQNRFAHLAGLTSGFMSQLLSGIRNPSSATRTRLLASINRAQRLKGAKEYEFTDIFRLGK